MNRQHKGSVFKKLEKRVYQTFEKALVRNGYLSLRSIIESQYRFPRTFIIEPIRKSSIEPRINFPSSTLRPQQAYIGQHGGRGRPTSLTEVRFLRLREELGNAVHQLKVS